MTRPSQKQAERLILDEVLRLRGLTGEVRDGPEPPDFVLEVQGQTIGFEIVQYHKSERTPSGFSRRQVEAEWDALRDYVVEFRKKHSGLEGLNVLLDFLELRVPSSYERKGFVKAVTAEIEAARPRIGREFLCLEIGLMSATVLRQYLRAIEVRNAGISDWMWNFDAGWVGTSEDELLAVIAPKLSYLARPDIHSSHLVVSGWRGRMSQIIAPWPDDQLSGFERLNAALEAGPYEEVVVLCFDEFVWVRGRGWRSLNRNAN